MLVLAQLLPRSCDDQRPSRMQTSHPNFNLVLLSSLSTRDDLANRIAVKTSWFLKRFGSATHHTYALAPALSLAHTKARGNDDISQAPDGHGLEGAAP
jgi:hypothetical protein